MGTASTNYRDDEKLRKDERLRKRRDFLETRRNGRRRASRHFVVYANPNGRAHSRLGLTASTKVGQATVRNWWKRRLREIFRRNKREFPPGYDFVVIVKGSSQQAPTRELETELIDLFNQAAQQADE